MRYNFNVKSPVFEPGKYVVIDPCYVFGNNDTFWNDFCYFLGNQRYVYGFIEIDNYYVYYFNTKYGDGQYPVYKKDDVDNTYEPKFIGVDSGMLSIIPIEIFDKYYDRKVHNENSTSDLRLGAIIELKKQTIPENKNCNVKLGKYRIDTR